MLGKKKKVKKPTKPKKSKNPPKPIYPKEMIVEICNKYINEGQSSVALSREYGPTKTCITRWVRTYKLHGEDAFDKSKKEKFYTREFKQKVVEEHLKDHIPVLELTAKYKISNTVIYQWIKMYNSHMEMKDYVPANKEIYMTKDKQTTIEEKIEIAKHCIKHDLDYKGTAAAYGVAYQNVYMWVKKYRAYGEEGLYDRRGKRKKESELTESERYERKVKELERELDEANLTIRLLKKAQEKEREW